MSSSLERAAPQSLRCFSWKAVLVSRGAPCWPRRRAQELRCSKAGVVCWVLAVMKLNLDKNAESLPELIIDT